RGDRDDSPRPGAAASVLGQLRRASHPRRAARAAPADSLPGEGRGAAPPVPILSRAEGGALPLPLPSPRHQHELKAFRQHPLPNDMLFLPGVIDSTTNVVEHPEVVADRITAAVAAGGDRTRVLASVDCGFGTFAGSMLVEESVVWTKLRTLRV